MGRALRPRKGTTAVTMDAPKVVEASTMPRKIIEVPKLESKKENALSEGSGSTMTEYEMLRAMRVARNAAVLAELGVRDEMADLARDAASMKRKIAPHKGLEWQKRTKKSNEPIVMRRSLRTQGIAPSGELSLKDDHENAGPVSPAFDERPRGDVKMQSIYAGDIDTRILSRLRALRNSDHDSSAAVDVSEMKHNSTNGAQNADVQQLQLVQKDVAKVAVKNIFCISFLPTTNRLVAATGDKAGYVGLWDVDAEADADEGGVGEEEAKGGGRSYDGVHVFHPHSKPVSAIQVHPHDISKVYTCSSDGSVRVTDVDHGMFEELHVDDSSDFSAMCLSPCARVAYVGDGDGDLSILDLRAKKSVSQFGLHSRKVNSVQINPQREHLVLTASTDNTAMLWDLRRWDATSAGSGVSPSKSASPKPLYVLSHSKAVNSAYFSPDGMRIGSTSYDNCVRVWDDVLSWAESSLASPRVIKTMKQPTIIKHDNQTGRWIASFRAVWSWDCHHLFVGNMNRALDVLSVSHPNQRPLSLKCDVLEAIPARLGVHPLLPVVGGGGGSRIYIWRPPM